jgi:formylglycine-generating enzyme required for sulfatase activity
MANNWAIAIGINHYEFLPNAPLRFAENDALAMQRFLCEDAKFDPDKVMLCGDGSNGSQRATRSMLRQILLNKLQHAQNADNLWFFFSGHGMAGGDRQDYLMTIDGNPDDLEDTAISIHFVTDRLRACNAKNIVLVLDMCRNESREVGRKSVESVEASLRQLVQDREGQQGIITLFSCGRGQSSYEIENLKQGAFTYALLEGLRQTTILNDLETYLMRRVPELHRSDGRARQQIPLVISEPSWKREKPILSDYGTVGNVLQLKDLALDAEDDGDLDKAIMLWEQVNLFAKEETDRSRALEALRRLFVFKAQQAAPNILNPPPAIPPQQSSVEFVPITLPELPAQVSISDRRNFIKWIGFGGTGVVLAFVLPRIIPVSPITSSQPAPTQLPRALLRLSTTEFVSVNLNDKGNIISQKNRQAQSYQEYLEGNTLSLTMLKIPGGEFLMGSSSTEKGASYNEIPQHKVSVPAFYMGQTVVTQEQWQKIMGNNNNPSHFIGDGKLPVDSVLWEDAQKFCDTLSLRTQRKYRLPTEAEWEYACRAGTTTPFHFGQTITTDVANFNGNQIYKNASKGKYLGKTTPVGSYKVANDFGLYDMHGNICEWCLDRDHGGYEGAPSNGSAWLFKTASGSGVCRGGAWNDYPRDCRSATHIPRDLSNTDSFVGFRVVCEIPGIS